MQRTIFRGTDYQRQRRTSMDAMLRIKYHDGSILKKGVEFSSAYNITAQNAWTVSFFVSNVGGTTSNLSTTFAALFAKNTPTYLNSRYYRKGIIIGTRKNNGVTGEFGNSAKPLNNYRFEILMGDGTNNTLFASTDFNFVFNCGYHVAIMPTVSVGDISTYECYVNSFKQPWIIHRTEAVTVAAINNAANYRIGYAEFEHATMNQLNHYGFNGNINHIKIYNKRLNQEEIAYEWKTGRTHKNAWINVQDHLPLVQPFGTIAHNIAEQYNYGRTPVYPSHGTLLNYTDEEAANTNPNRQQVYKDFHALAQNKLQYYFYAKDWRGNTSSTTDLVNHPDYFFAPHAAAHEWGSQDIEVEMTFALSRTDFAINLFYKPGLGIVNFAMTADYFFILFRFGDSPFLQGRIQTLLPPAQLMTPGKFHKLTFKKITHDASLWKILIDDKQLASEVAFNQLTAGYNCTTTDTIRYFAHQTDNAGELKFKECKLKIGNTLISHWQVGHRGGRVIHDAFGIANIDFNHRVNPEYTNTGNRAWREGKSNRIPIVNALRFRKSLFQYATVPNFVPTIENGYTTIIGFALESNRTFGSAWQDHFLSKRDGTKNIAQAGFYNGANNLFYYRTRVLHTPPVMNIRLNYLNLLISTMQKVGTQYVYNQYLNGELIISENRNYAAVDAPDYSLLSGNLAIGADIGAIGTLHFDGYLFYTGIAKGVITLKQVREVQNHSFFSMPYTSWSNLDWQLLVNYGYIKVNGTTYTLEDLSGKDHIVTLQNFTPNNVTSGHADYSIAHINNVLR